MVSGMAGPLSATQRVQAAKALFVARKIMRARQTRRAAMFDRLRAMVLGVDVDFVRERGKFC